MADIQFPNLGNALMAGSHAGYYRQEAEAKANLEKRRLAAQPDIAAAVGGDNQAFGRVAAADPATAHALAPVLQRLDAHQAAKVKGAADFTATASNAVLQANPAERPGIYAQMIEQGTRNGYDMSKLPPTYSPAVDGALRFHRAQAVPIVEWFKQEQTNIRHNTPQATSGGGGGLEPMSGPSAGPTPMPAAPRPVMPPGRPVSAAPMPAGPVVADAAPPVGQPPVVPQVAAAPQAPPVQVAEAPPPAMPAPQQPPVMEQGDGGPPASPAGPNGPPKQQGAIWNTDPSTQGYQMMGHRSKPGQPLLPAEVGGHFVYRNPQTGETVLYKPHAEKPTERVQPPPNYRHGPMGADGQPTYEFIPGSAADPAVIASHRKAEDVRGKPLDNSARDDLTKNAGGALEIAELVRSFKPEFGGYMLDAIGDARNFAKRNLPDSLGGADPEGQAQWWQRYQAMSNIERNRLFGASLTAGEQAAWKAATVTPGMKPDQIKENLTRQRDIAQKALSRIANSMAESGYNKAAIEAATGVAMGDLPSPMGGVPQAGPAEKARDKFNASKGGPKIGAVEDGHRFKGGNPADPNSWEAVR